MKNVLVLSGTASAINYIKSLGQDANVDLHVTDSNRYCPGLYMPGVTSHWVPRARDRVRYLAALDRILSDHRIDVLIPTSDYDVEGVMHCLHEGWTPNVAMFRPPFPAYCVLSDKGRLMRCMGECLPAVVPRTGVPVDAARDLGFPLVIKPTRESGGKGVTIVRHQDDLATSLARARSAYGDEFLLQQFVPGRTYIVSMVYDQEGRLVIAAGMRSHVTFFTWGGGGCAGEMVDEPELLRLCAEVIAGAGGWRGPINLEWRRHAETGAFYLLEGNCRLNGYSYLTTMNGLSLPRIVLALLIGDSLPHVSKPCGSTRNFVLGFRETLVESWVGS